MANLRTIFELAVRGGTETQRQLEQVGKVGAEAFKKIDEGAKKVPASLRAVDAAASTVKGKLDGLAQSSTVLGSAFQAIGGPVGLAAVGVLGLGAAFTALTKKAFDAAGSLVDTADATGLTIEQLQKYHIAAATAGVSSQQFDDAVQTLNKTVGQAQAGTGRLSKLLGTLDGDLLNNLKSATSSGERFELLAKKLANTESASQRVAIATAAGGQAFAKLLPLLKDGENGFTAIGESAERAGAIMSDSAARAADDAADKFTALAAILEGQVNNAFIQTAPLIENIATAALDAVPSVLAFVNSFLPAQTPNESLRRLEERISGLRNQVENADAEGPNFIERALGLDNSKVEVLKGQLRELEKEQDKLRTQASATAEESKRRHDARVKEIKDEIAATQAAVKAAADAKKSEQEGAAAARKAASDAEAARKKAASDHAAGIDAIIALEQKAQEAGLEGIEKIEAERDVAYQKFAELVEQDGLNQEEAARGYLAIWTAADREITAEREKESEKRAAAAQKEADKQAAAAQKAADKAQEEFQKPFDNAVENIQRDFGDMFTNVFENGLDGADDFGKNLKHIFSRLAGELTSLLVIKPILGAIGLGQQQPGGGVGGINLGSIFGGNGSTGIFGKLFNGVVDLGKSIFGLSGDVSDLGQTIEDSTFVGPPNPADTGPPAPSGGGTGLESGASGAMSSGAALGAAGAVLGILGVAFGTAAAVDAVRRTRRFKFTAEDVFKEANKAALDSQFGQLGELIGAGHTASAFFNPNAKAGDRAIAGILTIGTSELLRAAGGTKIFKPPTGGTALRANFEEFIESTGDDGANVNFFSGNRFKRGIGQKGTRKILERDFPQDNDGDFVKAMRQFNDEQRIAIGLTEKEFQQFTGLAAAFRGGIGKKAGNEEQRTLAIIADTLGSLAKGGVKAGEAMEIVGTAIEALGPPAEVFRTLNDFFTSDDNDIAVQDYADAVQGLAQVFFADVPLGVRAADLALQEFQKDGVVTFEELATRVLDVSAATQLLVPVFQQLTNAISNDPGAFLKGGVVDGQAITDFHDAVLDAMKAATIQGFVEGMLQAVLEPTILEPFTKIARETFGKIQSGEITPEEGLAILEQAGTDAAAALDQMDPFIQQFITDVAHLSEHFDSLSSSADKAGDALDDVRTPESEANREAFSRDIDRQLLGQLDPRLAAKFDQEANARARLHDAREFGIEPGDPQWLKIERLNELERTAIVEAAAEERMNIEEQAADEIQRIIEQNVKQAEQALKGIASFITDLTTNPAFVTPEDALATAQKNFNDIAAKARAGDLEAIQDLPEAGDKLLAASQTLFGSTERGADIFKFVVDTLKDIAGLDPDKVKLSADAQAQIDAINKDKTETLAKLDKHHEEAMALFQAMLDALLVSPTGQEVIDHGGGSPGDFVHQEPKSGGGAGGGGPKPDDVVGQFGLTFANQQGIKGVVAGAKQNGETHKALVQLLNLPSLAAISGLSGGSLAQKIGVSVLSLFPGVGSKEGFDRVVLALDNKIFDPETFSPVLGFATGGSFRVNGSGGPDSVPLPVRVSPNESVTVTTHGMDDSLREIRDAARDTARYAAQGYEETRKTNARLAELEARLSALQALYQRETGKPVPFTRHVQ